MGYYSFALKCGCRDNGDVFSILSEKGDFTMKLLKFLFAMAITAFFSACSGDTDNEHGTDISSSSAINSSSSDESGSDFAINPQIYSRSYNEETDGYNYQKWTGNGVIKLRLTDGTLIDIGNVVNGMVTELEFPANISEQYLFNVFEPDSLIEYPSVSPKNAKRYIANFVLVPSELATNERIVSMVIEGRSQKDNASIFEMIRFWYSPEPVKITGPMKYNDYEDTIEYVYDMDLKIGWNKFYSSIESIEEYYSYESNGIISTDPLF